MSETLDLARSIHAADDPSSGGLTGVAAVEANWRDFQGAWEDYHVEAAEYRQLDDERVLVIVQLSGRGKTSGLDVAQTGSRAANIFHARERKVRKLVIYWDGDRALADLGLAE